MNVFVKFETDRPNESVLMSDFIAFCGKSRMTFESSTHTFGISGLALNDALEHVAQLIAVLKEANDQHDFYRLQIEICNEKGGPKIEPDY